MQLDVYEITMEINWDRSEKTSLFFHYFNNFIL